MSEVNVFWRFIAAVAVSVGLGAGFLAGSASAGFAMESGDTVWLCKPGQVDDLCAGTIDGTVDPPPGQSATPLTYARPDDAPVDCFYLYPTQSDQGTPNSNLDKDPPIRRVAVQQARMFSSVCDVYAPMYRQVTNSGSQASHNDEVETAYQSALAGWKDYLENYNNGRGFILLGHSQGSAHTARLIDEEIDGNPELRDRMVGAYAPGANINVPVGKLVGGMYQNVPACSETGEFGCLVAFSTYKGYPGDVAAFSRLDVGYWIYDLPRPDADQQEVVCVNPARLDGGDGVLEPLINFDYLFAPPAGPESAAPWRSQPDYYAAECMRQNGAHWLNLSTLDLPGDARADLASVIASGNNYHVPEVNLAEGNLVRIAQLQTDGYVAREALRADLSAAEAKLTNKQKKLKKAKKQRRKLGKRAKRAGKKCKAAKRSGRKAKAKCKAKRKLSRKKSKARKRVKKIAGQVKTLKTEIRDLESQIG